MVNNPSAMWETWVQSQGWEDPLEEGMATHSSILVWRIPMDRGTWQVVVHGVAKSWTWLRVKAFSSIYIAVILVMSLNHALIPLHPILSANLSLSWTSDLGEIHYCCLSHPDCGVWHSNPSRPIHHSSGGWSPVRQPPSPPSSPSSSPSSQQVPTRGSTLIITAGGGAVIRTF